MTPESVPPAPLLTLFLGLMALAIAVCIIFLVHVVAAVVRTQVLLCPRCWHRLDSSEFCGECGWNYR